MVKFAHIADVHLGGWKQQPLQDLNLASFKLAISACIDEKVSFVIIAGDLFDNAFPPIDVLKETFAEFKRLKDSGIPCFLIAGSHDYSVSGKTFLDVLEKAGFCKNVAVFEEKDGKIILQPSIYKGVAVYGYPGKTSGLELLDLRRVALNDAPGMFKIFMLHTTIDKAKGDLPIDALETAKVPKADYYAMGHLHIDFQYENFVYPGPVFPNNFQELEDLKFGRFYVVNTELEKPLRRVDLKIKDVLALDIEIKNSLRATSQILSELEKHEVQDKVVLLRLHGILESGKHSDIKFSQIDETVKKKGAYFMLKNTNDLKIKETESDLAEDMMETENVEEEAIKSFAEKNPSDFNKYLAQIMQALSTEKQEGETTETFVSRLLDETKKIFNLA